tara:strand:- start:1013 stop:1327 length:315 start_codon:yes stop_codon:yes gene_type:complete
MLDEVAPPSAKHERMVKHIKKSYSKDGKLTDREKSIAYATAWKHYNKEEHESVKDELLRKSAEKHKKAKTFKQWRRQAGQKPLKRGEVRRFNKRTGKWETNKPD